MSIHIHYVRIAGFRGIKNLEISLPRVTVLIGTNNSGKTSVIKALQLALGDYSRFLSDEDFHIDDEDKRCEEILVDYLAVPIDSSGKFSKVFNADWTTEFGDNIQAFADGSQFLAIRTSVKPDNIKGGFITERFGLDQWEDFSNWHTSKAQKSRRIRKRFDVMPYISIDAQRDIHQELMEKSSYIGRVLNSVKYDDNDVKKLEEMVANINQEAVEKSAPLKGLKESLDLLNRSFDGSGRAELTPFPKKIRDLSKRFSVNFGESDNSSFSMEYHGMGTRSWASMLTVQAFVDQMGKAHEEEAEPFHPIVAAEEPEAHLHPNAQRTIYSQLTETSGQVILSSHSPYFVAMSDLRNIRSLTRTGHETNCNFLTATSYETGDLNTLHREVIRSRGEILFSKALILFEGVTEEQLIPPMFEHYFGRPPFELGVNCIGVNGKKNYPPFIKLACSLGIPIYIISDNDGETQKHVSSQIEKVKKSTNLKLEAETFGVSYLSEGHDLEEEIITTLGLKDEALEALIQMKTCDCDNAQYVNAKRNEIEQFTNEQILESMRANKASYAAFLAAVISQNPKERNPNDLIPQAALESFVKINEWLKL